MTNSVVYCDFNATTPLRDSARDAMLEAMDCFGNPSSSHSYGRRARGLLERSRDKLAEVLNASPEDVVFTSCGSEANNTILKSFEKRGAKLFVSAIEHACILKAVPEADRLPVTSDGALDLDALKSTLEEARKTFDGPILLAVMYANNETGVIQPIKEIVEIAKNYDVHVHCDAVQMLGKVPIDFQTLGVNSLSFSAHKIGGPKGAGAYIVRPQLQIEPLIYGGGQERGCRSGTENVIGISGFRGALETCFDDDWVKIKSLRDDFEKRLQEIVPGVKIYGKDAPRMSNTSYISMPGFNNQMQVIAFDLERICLGSGSACSSGKTKASHVLKAMGVSDEEALQAVRISLGWQSTHEDIDRILAACQTIFKRSQTVGSC